ncbi:unnamed protein product [Cunninghamella blakesleeana]
MDIPNEVLFYIFQYFKSPRYLATFSLVCKDWYTIATQPYFYQTIIIYNPKQLHFFINTAYNTRHHGKEIGCYVKHLILLFTAPISRNTMTQLQLSCPNLLTIYYNLNSYSSHPYNNNSTMKYELLGYWRHLTILPSWYKEDRFAIISSYHSTLTNFTLYPTLNDLNDILTSNPINGLHLFKSTFTQLKELCLDFSQYQFPFNMNINYLNVIHYCCPTITKLTIVNALLYKGVNQENKKKRKRTLQQKKYQQRHPNQVNYLCFENISIEKPSFFNFISKKYPLLQSLLLYNITFIDNQQSDKEYQSAIKKMITTDLTHLNELGVTIANKAYHYWPNDALLTWLHDHPNKFKYLHWPFTIYPTEINIDNDSHPTNKNTEKKKSLDLSNDQQNQEKENNNRNKNTKEINSDQQSQAYNNYIPIFKSKPKINFMNHLNTLTLKLSGDNTKTTLDYLLHGSSRGMISKTITTLTLEPLDWSHFTNDHKPTFYVYNWLDAFPALKRLYLHYFDICLHERFNIIYPEKKALGRPPSASKSSKSSTKSSTKSSKSLKSSKSSKSSSKTSAKLLLSSPPHSLEELTLFQCSIKNMNGFTLLCQQCPRLTVLENYNCHYFINEEETKSYNTQPYYTLLYVPQSSFQKLTFQGLIKLSDNSVEVLSSFDLFVKMIPFSLITTQTETDSAEKATEVITTMEIEIPSPYKMKKKNKKKSQKYINGKGQHYYFNSRDLDSKKKPLMNIIVHSIDVLNFGGNFLIH